MVELISGLRVETIRANLAEVREEIATAALAAGRDPGEVEVLAATKYVSVEDLPVLAEAGVGLVGENRAQDLVAKVAAHGEMFAWDFIGRLQSRKVQHDRAARAADPLGRLRVRRCASSPVIGCRPGRAWRS